MAVAVKMGSALSCIVSAIDNTGGMLRETQEPQPMHAIYPTLRIRQKAKNNKKSNNELELRFGRFGFQIADVAQRRRFSPCIRIRVSVCSCGFMICQRVPLTSTPNHECVKCFSSFNSYTPLSQETHPFLCILHHCITPSNRSPIS